MNLSVPGRPSFGCVLPGSPQTSTPQIAEPDAPHEPWRGWSCRWCQREETPAGHTGRFQLELPCWRASQQFNSSPAVASASTPPLSSPWLLGRPRRTTPGVSRWWRWARRRRRAAVCRCSSAPGRSRCGRAGCRAGCRRAQRPGSRRSSPCRRPSPGAASGLYLRSVPSACRGSRLGRHMKLSCG